MGMNEIVDILTKVVPLVVALIAIPLTVFQVINTRRSYRMDKYEKLKEIIAEAKENEALALFGMQSLLGKRMTVQELRIFTKQNYPIVDLLHSNDDRKAVKFSTDGSVIDSSIFKTRKAKYMVAVLSYAVFTIVFIVGFSIFRDFVELGISLHEKWYISLLLAIPTYYTIFMICIATFQFFLRKIIQIRYLDKSKKNLTLIST